MTREEEKYRIIELKIQAIFLLLQGIQERLKEIQKLQLEVSHGR